MGLSDEEDEENIEEEPYEDDDEDDEEEYNPSSNLNEIPQEDKGVITRKEFYSGLKNVIEIYSTLIHDNTKDKVIHKSGSALRYLLKELSDFRREDKEQAYIKWGKRFQTLVSHRRNLETFLIGEGIAVYEPPKTKESSKSKESQTIENSQEIRGLISLMGERKYGEEIERILEGYDTIIRGSSEQELRIRAERGRGTLKEFLREEGLNAPLDKRIEALDYHKNLLDAIRSV